MTRSRRSLSGRPSAAPDPTDSPRLSVGVESRRRLGRASIWSVATYGGVQALRFIGNVVLWRLLFEEAFGIMALVNALLQALQMFSDIGIGPSIVQNQRGSEASFLNTAWTLQVVRGVTILLISILIAAPMAALYDQPELLEVVPVVGVAALLQGFFSTRLFTEQKNLSLGRMSAIELGGQTLSTVVMIGWALVWPSVWALAIGGVAGAALKLTLSHTLLPGVKNRFLWDRRALKELVTFGRWIFLSTLLTFLAREADRFVFGALIPIGVLGVYSIALALATLPNQLLGGLVMQAVFPHLSKERERGAPIGPAYQRVRTPVALLAAWAFTCLLSGGPTLVDVLYGDRAAEAGWMVQILALGGWFGALRVLAGAPLLALGIPKWHALANGVKVATMLVTIPVGFSLAGFPGAVAGFAVSELANYGAALIALTLHGLRTLTQDLLLTVAIAAIAGLGLAVREGARSLGLPPLVEGIAIAIVVTLPWALAWRLRAGIATLGRSAPAVPVTVPAVDGGAT